MSDYTTKKTAIEARLKQLHEKAARLKDKIAASEKDLAKVTEQIAAE